MLSYILPPIIIIIGVSALITFLFRKVDEMPQQELSLANTPSGERRNSKFVSELGHLSLKVLERMMHHLKLLSLKFHNVSNEWFQTIREKRQKSVQMERENAAASVSKSMATAPIESVPEQPYAAPNSGRVMRPMIRPEVTRPQLKKEKNQFEDTLIKRIAINPKDIEAYERLGDYYLEHENFQDSLECFKQVLKLSPVHHKARLRIRRLEKMVK